MSLFSCWDNCSANHLKMRLMSVKQYACYANPILSNFSSLMFSDYKCLSPVCQQTPQILEMRDLFSIMSFFLKTGMFKSTPPALSLAPPLTTTL